MSEPNTERVALAAAAGAAGTILALIAGAVWFGASIAGTSLVMGSPEPLGLGARLFTYAVASISLTAAGLLLARIIGASWRLTLIVSVGASMAVSAIVDLSGFEPEAVSFALIAAPGIVALVAAVATGADPAVIPTLVLSTGFLIGAGIAMLSAGVFILAVLVSLSGWVALPAVASLFQPSNTDGDDRPQGDGSPRP